MKEAEDSTTNIKISVLQMRKRLTALGIFRYVKAFIEDHPEYDTREESQRIRNLFNGVVAEKEFTSKLEKWVKKLEAQRELKGK